MKNVHGEDMVKCQLLDSKQEPGARHVPGAPNVPLSLHARCQTCARCQAKQNDKENFKILIPEYNTSTIYFWHNLIPAQFNTGTNQTFYKLNNQLIKARIHKVSPMIFKYSEDK